MDEKQLEKQIEKHAKEMYPGLPADEAVARYKSYMERMTDTLGIRDAEA